MNKFNFKPISELTTTSVFDGLALDRRQVYFSKQATQRLTRMERFDIAIDAQKRAIAIQPNNKTGAYKVYRHKITGRVSLYVRPLVRFLPRGRYLYKGKIGERHIFIFAGEPDTQSFDDDTSTT